MRAAKGLTGGAWAPTIIIYYSPVIIYLWRPVFHRILLHESSLEPALSRLLIFISRRDRVSGESSHLRTSCNLSGALFLSLSLYLSLSAGAFFRCNYHAAWPPVFRPSNP